MNVRDRAYLQRIRQAAGNGDLLRSRHLLSNLFRWRDFAGTSDEVRLWTGAHLADNGFVVRLAGAITSTAWVTHPGLDGMGDRVSQGVPHVQLDGLEAVVDVNRLLNRIGEVEATLTQDQDKRVVARFRDGMRRREEERSRRARRSVDVTAEDKPDRNQEVEIFADAMVDEQGNNEHAR
jgi:hypothetical protein